jgi:hypothetical protein
VTSAYTNIALPCQLSVLTNLDVLFIRDISIHLYMLMTRMKRTSRLVSTEKWHGKASFVYADVMDEEDVKIS